MYVCFEALLGAHLKGEVEKKIWMREYVDIFTLLPLERFNLDRPRDNELKADEEERWCFRLIPRTFGNWSQAFFNTSKCYW